MQFGIRRGSPAVAWQLSSTDNELANRGAQLGPGVLEADEAGLPDTFLLQAEDEVLDDAVVLGRVKV